MLLPPPRSTLFPYTTLFRSPLALIVDPEILVRFRVVPARVSLHRNPSSADYLVLWQIEHDVVRGELAVKLASRIERMVFPAVAVVHHHLGIPLREVEAPPLAPLAPRQGGWTRLPVDLDRQRIAGAEGSRQGPVRDGRVGGIWVVGAQPLAHHGRTGDAFERVVRILQVLKPLALLSRVGGGPAGAGTECVQVLVDVEVAQCVGGAVHVADAHMARERSEERRV